MEPNPDLWTTLAVWALFAFALFATGMHAWLRIRATGSPGADGEDGLTEAERLGRRAKLWRFVAGLSAIAALICAALRWR